MKSITKGDRTNYNFHRVLRNIWLNEGISRIEICNKLDLDKATVSTIVSFLIEMGIAEETEKILEEVKPGRRPIGLGITRTFGYSLGVEVHIDGIRVTLVDMRYNIVWEKNKKIITDYTNLAEVIIDIYNEASQLPLLQGRPILGMGVSVPGIVDQSQQKITHAYELKVLDNPYDLKSKIQDHLPIPCFFDNNANCCAWGVLAEHRQKEYKNFLFVYFGFDKLQDELEEEVDHVGMGLGIVLDGQIYVGPNGSAGEFSSTKGGRNKISQFSLSREEMGHYREDEKIQKKLMTEAAQHIGLFVNTFNFQHLFIGGDVEYLTKETKMLINNSIEKNWPYPSQVNCEVEIFSGKKETPATGAAGMFLEKLFTIPTLSSDTEQSMWQIILG